MESNTACASDRGGRRKEALNIIVGIPLEFRLTSINHEAGSDPVVTSIPAGRLFSRAGNPRSAQGWIPAPAGMTV